MRRKWCHWPDRYKGGVNSAAVSETVQPVRPVERAGDLSALAGRVAAGDQAAEEGLCRRLAPRIWAWGVRYLGDDQDARDLTQEVLVIVLEALRAGRVASPAEIGAFALGTCRLVVRDRRRTDDRRRALLAQFPPDLVCQAVPGPTGADLDRLHDCLRKLPYGARQVLLMTYFEEASPERIAAAARTTVGNVRVIRHRSLTQLRGCLERCGEAQQP